eukprot:scaffold3734_cov425-Prasinococcus_capsulatus_cf.AAC.1
MRRARPRLPPRAAIATVATRVHGGARAARHRRTTACLPVIGGPPTLDCEGHQRQPGRAWRRRPRSRPHEYLGGTRPRSPHHTLRLGADETWHPTLPWRPHACPSAS